MNLDIKENDITNYNELRSCNLDEMINWLSGGYSPCARCMGDCGSEKCKKKIKKWLLSYDQEF
jgi:hypothetical protein